MKRHCGVTWMCREGRLQLLARYKCPTNLVRWGRFLNILLDEVVSSLCNNQSKRESVSS